MEDYVAVLWIHHLPACLDCFYIAFRTQVQQGSHHKVYVVFDVTYLSNVTSDDCWHHATLPGCSSKPFTILVRMGIVSVAQWTLVI